MYFQYRGIPYDYIPVNLVKGEQRTEEYASKLNPAKVSLLIDVTLYTLQLVPSLVVKDGDREEFVMTESMAICEYFEEMYPDLPRLLPTDPYKKW